MSKKRFEPIVINCSGIKMFDILLVILPVLTTEISIRLTVQVLRTSLMLVMVVNPGSASTSTPTTSPHLIPTKQPLTANNPL